jgi:NAD(P)-dependent dehydrogenase (short-subunit alcohol dehydrogenase family)
VLGVNVGGFFRITQLAVEQMLQQGGGHVVQITTSLVEHPNSAVPSVLASLSKGGLQAATTALAIEYASRGIRSNAVALGTVKTPMHPEQHHAALARLHPVGRMGEISDVTDAVVYLENAPFVTGVILPVDGGQTAGH